MKYKKMVRHHEPIDSRIHRLSKEEVLALTTLHPSDWPNYLKHKMIANDFMSTDGKLTPKGEILFEGLRDNFLDGDIS